MRRRSLLPLAALALCGARVPDPPRDDNTLRVLWDNPVTDLHPYFAATHEAFVVAHHVWDTLLARDPETLQLRPALARSWRQTGAAAFEFELRDDIVFHDGALLSADDVVATVLLATTDPRVAVPDNYGFLGAAVAFGAHHVRLTLAHPFPPALDYIATVLPILRTRTVDDALPPGTGPYRIAQAAPARLTLARYENHAGPKPSARIETIVLAPQPDAAARLAAVASGEADWTWDVGPALFADAQRDPSLTALRTETMRVCTLAMDAAGRGDTPFADARVRRAVALGLDRAAIAAAAAPLGARPLDVPCYPTQFGCDLAAVAPVAPDPAAGRAALAAAGFAAGFATELVTALPPRLVLPVVAGLRALGIEAAVPTLTQDAGRARLRIGDAPLSLRLGPGTGVNDVSSVLPEVLGGGPLDFAGDAAVQSLILQAGRAADPDQRRQAYSQALRRTGSEALLIPLYAYVRTTVFTRTLNARAYPDDIPRFHLASWR